MNTEDRIILLTDKDVNWSFEGEPSFYVKGQNPETYGHSVYLDPFPCYAHDKDKVVSVVKEVESKFPVGFPVTYYLFCLENKCRTNGTAYKNHVYNRSNKDGQSPAFDPCIILSGKRIPLHPAMTRYLISHEYGHIVHYWLEYCLNIEERGDATKFEKDYAAMRKIDVSKAYGARNWHTNIGEIIVNDFRISICGIENEFWPHPCSHPLETPEVLKFWAEMKEKHAYVSPLTESKPSV